MAMTRHVRLREMLVGIEGLALLRHLYDGTDAEAERRLAEVRHLLDSEESSTSDVVSEADPRTGYRAWSDRYDDPGNPIIALEEPVVWSLVGELRPGSALDAACGTGRHTRRLVDLGHRVTGVDITVEMLRRAATAVPKATFVEADLRELPTPPGTFDLVVCGLALAHIADLDRAVGELARVLKRDGRMVVSLLHPFQAHLGWHAPFEDAEGRRWFVREHAHTHADYLSAFRRAGLQVRDCIEPVITSGEVQVKRRAIRYIPEATAAAYEGLPGVLVWDVEKV